MALRAYLGLSGLLTEPNPHLAPDGALRTASNVVFRRPGIAEPRPGFQAGQDTELDTVERIIPFHATDPDEVGYIAVGVTDDEQDTKMVEGGTATSMTDQTALGPALQWDSPDNVRGAESRGSVYLTTLGHVHRTRGVQHIANRVGVIPPSIYAAQNSGTGVAVPAGFSVAYRAIIERTYSNGLVVRSIPSGRAVYKNGSGVPIDVLVTYTFRHGHYVANEITDRLKIYRSLATTSDEPDDDMYLAMTIDLTVLEASQVDVVDNRPEEELTEELYTNSGREGPFRGNFRPPPAKDICLYNGSLFYFNVTHFARIALRWKESGTIATANGIGLRTKTGIRDNDSDEITSLSDLTGLKVGMVLANNASWNGSTGAPTRIIAIDVGTSTLTMSQTWGGGTDLSAVSLTFVDAICVDKGGLEQDWYRADYIKNVIQGVMMGDSTANGGARPHAFVIAYGTGDDTRRIGTTLQGARRSVVLEGLASTTTFRLCATHGSEYEPPLPEPGAFLDVAPGEQPSELVWTKNEQPEHYALASLTPTSVLVGNQSSPGMRALATRDALWLLKGKGDGIYRLSGPNEDAGFRLDKFDPDTHLLSPELACVHDDILYAWTNKGLVAISDAGVVKISKPRIGAEVRNMQRRLDGMRDIGAFACSNTKGDEVIFGLPDLTAPADEYDGACRQIYCFNTVTGALSTWFPPSDNRHRITPTCMVEDVDGRLLVGTSGIYDLGESEDPFVAAGVLLVERDPDAEDAVLNADLSHEVTVESVGLDDFTVVIDEDTLDVWIPEVGDLLLCHDVYGVVTGYDSETRTVTLHTNAGMEAGDATAYEPFTCAIHWTGRSEATPGIAKVFPHLTTHWESTFGVARYGVTALRNLTTGFSNDVLELGPAYGNSPVDIRVHAPRDLRTVLPTEVAYGTGLYAGVQIRQADARFQLSGITIYSEPLTDRVSK